MNAMLAIEQAVPGMIISEALLDVKGDVLLPKGTTLTAAIISSLQQRGIKALAILDEEPAADPLAEQAEQERLQKRLESLFRKCGSNEANGTLLRYLTQFRREPRT